MLRYRFCESTGRPVLVNVRTGKIVPGGYSAARMVVCLMMTGWAGSAWVRPIPTSTRYGPKHKR